MSTWVTKFLHKNCRITSFETSCKNAATTNKKKTHTHTHLEKTSRQFPHKKNNFPRGKLSPSHEAPSFANSPGPIWHSHDIFGDSPGSENECCGHLFFKAAEVCYKFTTNHVFFLIFSFQGLLLQNAFFFNLCRNFLSVQLMSSPLHRACNFALSCFWSWIALTAENGDMEPEWRYGTGKWTKTTVVWESSCYNIHILSVYIWHICI